MRMFQRPGYVDGDSRGRRSSTEGIVLGTGNKEYLRTRGAWCFSRLLTQDSRAPPAYFIYKRHIYRELNVYHVVLTSKLRLSPGDAEVRHVYMMFQPLGYGDWEW